MSLCYRIADISFRCGDYTVDNMMGRIELPYKLPSGSNYIVVHIMGY